MSDELKNIQSWLLDIAQGRDPEGLEDCIDVASLEPRFWIAKKSGDCVCLADLVWIINAHIALKKHPVFDLEMTPRHFKHFKLPEQIIHDYPISSMNSEQLMLTLDRTMWLVDGDLFSVAKRTEEWFDDLYRLLDLLRYRAYYLATHTADEEIMNAFEYTLQRDVAMDEPLPKAEDSEIDGFMPEIVEDYDVIHTHATNTAFVWDCNAMLSHLDQILRANAHLQRTRVEPEMEQPRQKIQVGFPPSSQPTELGVD